MKGAKIMVIFSVMFLLICGSDLTEAKQIQAQKSLKPIKITAKLRAVPPSYAGRCPKTIKFVGSITVSRATPVSYQFIRSDGLKSRARQMVFTQKGSKPVQTSWKLDKTTKGFMYIRVFKPLKRESAKAYINIRCTMKVGVAPHQKVSGPPPFAIKVETLFNPHYMGKIGIRATIIPKHANIGMVKAAVNGKMLRFFINNKLVRKNTANYPITDIHIPAEQTPALNLKPGIHKVLVMTAHRGKFVANACNMQMDKAEVKIHELSSKSIFYKHGPNWYPRCWLLGQTVKVKAKFTYKYIESVPIKNTKVHFRVHGVNLADATTNAQGNAEFTFVLTPAAFVDSRPYVMPEVPYDQKNYNFFLPETSLCQATTDRGHPDRRLRACPPGRRLVKVPGHTSKRCME